MSYNFQDNAEKAAAFHRIWAESLSKTAQAAWTSFSSGNSPPPEVVRQMRAGVFDALAQSWEQFMRSPEFLEVTRQWMEQTVSLRKATNDLVARTRKETQAPSLGDIEDIMLAVRHMEKRLLDRIDDISLQIGARQNGGKEAENPALPPLGRGRSRQAQRSARAAAPSSSRSQKRKAHK